MELIFLLLRHLNNRALFLFTALIILQIPAAATAQTTTASAEVLAQYQFLKVGAIHVQADGPINKQVLLDLIEFTPNVDILTTSKVRKSIELLYATGNFSNILVDAQKKEDRVELTFILRLIYRFQSIKVKGEGGPSYRKIKKALTLRKFEPYLPEKVLKGREQLLEALQNDGFLQARVTPDVLLLRSEKRTEVTYFVTPGQPIYVGELVFSGTPHFAHHNSQLFDEVNSRTPFPAPQI